MARRLFKLRIFCGLVAAVLMVSASQVRAATINSVTVSYGSTSVYVIDSDSRNTIPVSVTVGITGPSGELPLSYRVRFRLLDEQGTAVALVSDTELSNEISWPSFVQGGVPQPTSLTFTGNLDPNVRLNSNTQYRVEAQVNYREPSNNRWAVIGNPGFSSFRRFYHFTNTVANDAARNVIARQTGSGVGWSRRFAITSSPSQQGFVVTTPYELRRYDNYTAASPTDTTPVEVVWQVKLFREAGATDEEISLQSDPSFTTNVTVPFYVTGTPRTPAVVTGTATLQLKPAVQLDSRSTHYAVVTMSHRELPAPAAPVVSNTLNTTTDRILHFNGRLDFGSIQTRIDSINGNPLTGSSLEAGGAAVLCSPAIGLGRLLAPYQNHIFSGTLPVRLLADGRAIYNNSSQSVPVTAPTTPDKERDTGIAFLRENILLSTAGVSATIRVLPPSGMTVTTTADDRISLGSLPFGNQSLTQNLQPVSATLTYTPGSPVYVMEETKPVQIRASSITWVRGDGKLNLATTGEVRYAQRGDMNRLEAMDGILPPEQLIKRSNERYYAAVSGLLNPDVTIRALGSNSGAHLTAGFTFGSGEFRTHFPYDSRIGFTGGQMVVEEDSIRLDPSNSSLEGVSSIQVAYEQACLSGGCVGVSSRLGSYRLSINGQRLAFTRDGGLTATGTFATSYPVGDRTNRLEWGYINTVGGNPRFVHSHQNRFANGTFHATGSFLQPGESAHLPKNKPAVVHLSGFFAANPTAAPERPGSTPALGPYANGNADYAGINLRAAAPGNPTMNCESIIANQTTGMYPLKTRSKYYVRRSGVAGIHDAAVSPGSFELYGFPVSFANFSFGYRDNDNKISATLGEVSVPYPSDFTQPFEEMRLTCLGDLDKAEIPDDSGAKTLAYWAAEFQPYTMEFQLAAPCFPGGDAALAMMIETNVHHIPSPLQGKMGWYPTGRIVPLSDTSYSATSRFTLPTSLTVAGPGSEKYPATPASEAYFNDYDQASTSPGFVSFAVRIGVPYFEDLKVHCHTFAKPMQPSPGSPPSRLHLMGGWTASNKTFFSSTTFDSSHRGYPPLAPNVTLARYRNEGSNKLPAPPNDPSANDPYRQYRVFAKRSFLNVVDFDYPIEFIPGARVWTSSVPREDDLLVFNISHQIDRLAPSVADITFGASYKGIPALSLSNSAFNFVDEVAGGNPSAGGFRNILRNVLGPNNADTLNGGFSSLGTVTSDRFNHFATPFIASSVDPLITNAYNSLKNNYQNPTAVTSALGTFSNSLMLRLNNTAIDSSPSLLTSVRGQISGALQDAIDAIDVLTKTEGGSVALFDTSGNMTKNLIKALVSQGSPEAGAIVAEIAGPLLDQTISEQLDRGAPSLEDIRAALIKIRGSLSTVKSTVQSTGAFSVALSNIIAEAGVGQPSEIDAIVNHARAEIQSIVNNEGYKYFVQLPPSAFQDRVRARVAARLLSRAFPTKMLGVMRQYVYDADGEVRTLVDSGFRVTNSIVRKVLAEAIEEATANYIPALDDLDSILRGTNIDGYARINGDTLSTLRLDLAVDIDLMSSMKADFYLQIDCRQSTGDEACSWGAAGEYFTEVRMGADNVEAEWLGDMRLNVGLKFTLSGSGDLLGMGGSIELAGGKAKFEKFGLTDFGATAMFGKEENYVGARAKAEYNKKAIRVGFFFGRTCDIEPLKLVDKDVAKFLGNPPFTGGYVYGEMSYPLNEILGIPSTCFLSLTGTIGAGIWVFIEGPEYGGKLYMKIVGEVICIAEIGGEITLLGGKSGNDYKLAGKGRLWVEVCFLFCFEGEAGVRVKCKNSDCDFDIDV